jgi:V/A-type H+-transporting ATPase subunit C
MPGASKYAELAAAVRSFKAELTRPSQIERFVEAGSLSEIVGLLSGGRVTFTEGTDPNAVEIFLTQRVIELARQLAAYAPHESRSLIKLFPVRYELECVKVIIRSITDQIQAEDALRHLVPAGKFTQERCKELIEARNLNRVVEMIDDEALKRFLAPRVTAERSGIAALLVIDQHYYTRLWNASNLPDPLDAQSARGLIGELIDHLNILLSFRARLIGLDPRSTSDLMIPVNYALGHSLNELAESTSTQNLMRVLEKTPYAKAFQGPVLSDRSSASVERALNRSHAISCLDAFAGSPFNVGLALALLFLKNYELRDLFSIINGKANNASMEHVLNSLILRVA